MLLRARSIHPNSYVRAWHGIGRYGIGRFGIGACKDASQCMCGESSLLLQNMKRTSADGCMMGAAPLRPCVCVCVCAIIERTCSLAGGSLFLVVLRKKLLGRGGRTCSALRRPTPWCVAEYSINPGATPLLAGETGQLVGLSDPAVDPPTRHVMSCALLWFGFERAKGLVAHRVHGTTREAAAQTSFPHRRFSPFRFGNLLTCGPCFGRVLLPATTLDVAAQYRLVCF